MEEVLQHMHDSRVNSRMSTRLRYAYARVYTCVSIYIYMYNRHVYMYSFYEFDGLLLSVLWCTPLLN